MKPANGWYRLTSAVDGTNMLVKVDDTGMQATFGRLNWKPAQDCFAIEPSLKVVIRCLGGGNFLAIVNEGGPDEQVHNGTCVSVPMPPP